MRRWWGRDGNLGSIRIAIDMIVVDDELGYVIANKIRSEVGEWGQGVKQHGLAACGFADQRPAEAQGIAVGIEGAAAIH